MVEAEKRPENTGQNLIGVSPVRTASDAARQAVEGMQANVPHASYEQVRAALDKRMPDAVAREIVRSGMEKKMDAINHQAELLSKHPPCVQKTLENEDVARAFVEKPARLGLALKDIARAMHGAESEEINKAFSLLSKDFAPLFARYPEAFVATARDAKKDAAIAFGALDERDPKSILLEALSFHGGALKEFGRPLDYLHDFEKERMQYLNSLQPFEAVSLLCSDPSLFYTSSNHLLFDKLKLDFNTKGLTALKKEFALSNELTRNLLLRAINYNRLGDLISPKDGTQQDVKLAVDIVLGTPQSKTGIYSERFEPRDAYLMANGVETLRKYSDITGKINDRLGELEQSQAGSPTVERGRTIFALKYMSFILTGDAHGDKVIGDIGKRSVYTPADYKTGGKTNVIQIFDREDAHEEVDHWKMTNEWLQRQYGEPKAGPRGELTYENANARITLFMGGSKPANAKFIKDWVKKNQAGVITFRGHSFSLEENMPYDLFGNKPGKYLFIPGSCGSAGSIPDYMSANPATELAFFSNTATGRGAVTNTIIDLVAEQRKPIGFKEILVKGEKKIAALEGDIADIQVFNRGEQILSYVNGKEEEIVAFVASANAKKAELKAGKRQNKE